MSRAFHLDEPYLISLWAQRQRLERFVVCNGTTHRFLFPALLHKEHCRILERGSMYPEDFFLFQERAKREAGHSHSADLPPSIVDEIEKTKLAHFVICGSERVRQSYVSRSYRTDRTFTCHYGIDAHKFSHMERGDIVDRPLRLAMVGIFGLRKGPKRLLQIGEWAASVGLPLELWIVGPIDPPAAPLLDGYRGKLRCFGVQKGQALVDILHQADLYCLPSYEEGFPLSVLEAMATGLPAVVSADTGATEAVEEGGGVVLEDFSPAEMEQVLRPLMQGGQLRREMGAQARGIIERRFTIDCYRERLRGVYGTIRETFNADSKEGIAPTAWTKG